MLITHSALISIAKEVIICFGLFAGLSVSRITENITNDFVTIREIYAKDKTKTID